MTGRNLCSSLAGQPVQQLRQRPPGESSDPTGLNYSGICTRLAAAAATGLGVWVLVLRLLLCLQYCTLLPLLAYEHLPSSSTLVVLAAARFNQAW